MRPPAFGDLFGFQICLDLYIYIYLFYSHAIYIIPVPIVHSYIHCAYGNISCTGCAFAVMDLKKRRAEWEEGKNGTGRAVVLTGLASKN